MSGSYEDITTRAIVSNGDWIVTEPTCGLDDNFSVISTNNYRYHTLLHQELGKDIFGPKDVLLDRLEQFAKKHELEFVDKRG